ncbi:alcohol dehydrogenase [Mediterranea sp. An20]|uniref:iron-containing alcohol dehydrogenase n=1 Tax=Mediterranea sp. An20 TaxID=1965586 RepID=UPI000B37F042|nr:iron-containing alcohol dehydrogenase [Mediterranea sp. An20]OUP06092.1 alcohol dehydrogenase [Mediterranea sp. An20]
MQQFQFFLPTKVLFGAGQLKNLHLEQMPGKKALIVTSNGQSTKKYGYLAAVEKELEQAGVEHVLFDGVRPNPTRENVMDASRLAREQDCDFVVALGGGSVMDAGKCIALMMVNDGDLWDYAFSAKGGHKPFVNPSAPLIAITTSAGTGSEVDMFSVISNDELEEKTGVFDVSMFPVLSVVDSDLMMSVPPRLTAYQGMDAFFHAAESVINRNEHPMGEMFALKAIELIAKNLPVAYKNGADKEARANMALANSLAGFYMLCTSQHTMEHVMGSYYSNLEHGAGLIMLSHEYFSFFADRKAAEEPMIKMACAMGIERPQSGEDFIRALDDLIASVGCTDLKMSDYGITREEIKKWPRRIHEVLGGDITADPLPLSDEDYLGIYERSFK